MNKKRYLFIFLFFCVNIVFAQGTSYTVYLLGDGGAAKKGDPWLKELFRQIADESAPSAVVFLGDNIYPNGMPEREDEDRARTEAIIKAQIEDLKNYSTRVVMIPGNHDYAQGRRSGLERLAEQENYVNQLLGDSTFLPPGGCPDPIELTLNEDITLIVLDTQWLLYGHQDLSLDRDCECRSNEDVFLALQDIVFRNQFKQLVVVGHHPMYSHGAHGGYFPLKSHIFPFTDKVPWLYLPLPLVGSVYPLSRKAGVSPQDFGHPLNRQMRDAFQKIFAEHDALIYAAGHEHTLQHFQVGEHRYIVSGSGSKESPVKASVKKGALSSFATSERGFAKIQFFQKGKVNISYYNEMGLLYEDNYQQKVKVRPEVTDSRLMQDSITVPAATQYLAGKSRIKWMGENYREDWATPVKVPVFHLDQEKGGLKIVQRGGGMTTLSFRLEDKNGNQYVLRSIDKDPVKAVPEMLIGTIATEVVQDQISASYPYSALVVPKMADAVGIYHTNPKVVYVGNDPRFGIYQEIAADKLYLFEERPSKNSGQVESFGNHKKIISTAKVIEKLKEDNDNQVDVDFVLRNRLFDMVIGDWDRHDDQWRWVEIKSGKGHLYRPVPRDRDQVFFINEGILPRIASSRYILPKIEGFNETIRWEEGFNFNARYFDRHFLSEANQEDFQREALHIQKQLTDEVIDSALKALPDTLYQKRAAEFRTKLIARRNQLPQFAENYYQVLAKQVTILGSHKREQLRVKPFENGDTEISLHKISKKGKLRQQLYQRTFSPEETSEIRLFGMNGEDQYVFEGQGKSKTKIRVIGGEDRNLYVDSMTKPIKKNIIIYDQAENNEFEGMGHALKKRISKNPEIQRYNRREFKYDQVFPLLYAGYVPDDGVQLGGGVNWTHYGFRKEPYASKHYLVGAITSRLAFKVKYRGKYTDVIGKQDLFWDVELRAPKNSNFFGLGNKSEFSEEFSDDYYRFQYTYHRISPSFRFSLPAHMDFNLGLNYIYTDSENNSFSDDRYFVQSQSSEAIPLAFNAMNHLGPFARFQIDRRDSQSMPKKGFDLWGTASWNHNIGYDDLSYAHFAASFSLYKTLTIPKDLTLSYHIGGEHNEGTYHYLQSNKLGGKNDMRGFRRDRFWGRSSFWNNADMRLDLFDFKNSILPMTFGLTAFYDFGRIWLEDEVSGTWHRAYGGGIYLSPLDKIAFTATVGHSQESTLFFVDVGFGF
ncbi:metallophosphoesterase [Persicobacter diffluens]|uniref:metallophosphoesterase n=1 Tax=Persicobacter diffluens TaxID=981 RepID=UPI0030C7291F